MAEWRCKKCNGKMLSSAYMDASVGFEVDDLEIGESGYPDIPDEEYDDLFIYFSESHKPSSYGSSRESYYCVDCGARADTAAEVAYKK